METTGLKNDFESTLNQFGEITLDQMNEVKLLNRFDSKYVLFTSQLQSVLSETADAYFVLKIDGTRLQLYNSVYFDTHGDLFYLTHHNGKAGRYKVRKREYVNSTICFTEVKLKSNKGKTSKKRIASSADFAGFSAAEIFFLSQQTLVNPELLELKIKNSFNRVTLVSRSFDERCTIDINLSFDSGSQRVQLPGLAVIELKQGTLNQQSALAAALKRHKIQPSGFSKYCMGRALTEPWLKANRFKPKIMKIYKEYRPVISQLPVTKSFIA